MRLPFNRVAIAALAAAPLALIGCATVGPPVPKAAESIAISTSPGPWCGRCYSVTVVAFPDGKVWVESEYWAGRYRDGRKFRRVTLVDPHRFARFAAALEPHRPSGLSVLDDVPPCSSVVTDAGEITITWRSQGHEDQLIFDHSCALEGNFSVRDALYGSVELLEISGLALSGAPQPAR